MFFYIQGNINSDKYCDKQLVCQLLHNLGLSMEGLNNLKETYKEDRSFVCNLETLIENIEARIEELKNKYPMYFKKIEIEK